ncbi:hypothetical protein [Methylibium petroleiphilum]|uniref:DUF5655 domain-containing protein n=1 Tax=Methylibium petroleiphilum (strain ATCC BAA-1232 / LMG 22953 / PM1) TaxID=420662 RepID=A2SK43_METPP|nr:hypothetical protein [Methylibium petroleiphilum]ABM95932.1 conserved hypothetical protein [Methylibium petroleiphilum PM1]
MSVKLEVVNLRKHPTLTEKWVQDQIAEDPTILGIGELEVKDKERTQAAGGRLDLLLYDPDTLKRYEVEIQLGATDESHIIRTIEYWDIERRRYPQYEHAAVIVAEEITSRFLNVIQLFNGAIPLIALKMTVYKVGEGYALTFVKVLDEISYGLVDEDEPVAEPADRSLWEKKGSQKSLVIVEDLLQKVVRQVEPKATLKYNKHYIGIGVDGAAMNFVTFVPRKAHVIMSIKLPKEQETHDAMTEAGLEMMAYDTGFKYYRVHVPPSLDDKQRQSLTALVKQARQRFSRGE